MPFWSRRTVREPALYVGDPRFDGWEPVRDFGDLPTARAFLQQVHDAGIDGVLTSDWELDRFGHGDIALRVPPESYGDAEVLLSGLED